MKTFAHLLVTLALAFAVPVTAQAPALQIGAVTEPCRYVDPMPGEVAAYFASLATSRTTGTAVPLPTAAQLDIYRRWQARVRQQDFAQQCRYAAANAALPAATEHRVVYFGDSVTEYWASYDPAFFTGDVIDRGISGQTTVQMLPRFRSDVLDLKPAVVHIIAGTNDVAGNTGPTSLDRIVGNIASMIELAKLHGVKVVLGSELPCARYQSNPDTRPAELLPELTQRLRRLAGEMKITFVDYYTPLATSRGAFDARYGEDGLHPNTAGYLVMAPLARSAVRAAAGSGLAH